MDTIANQAAEAGTALPFWHAGRRMVQDVIEACNPELEAQIVADPDDDMLRRVYADWLIAAGNPRGELAALQLAGKHAEASAFLELHAEQLRGPKTGPYDARVDGEFARLVWKAGFWDEVACDLVDSSYQSWHAHPSARFLRVLYLYQLGPFESIIDELATGVLPALRKLVIGAHAEGQSDIGEMTDWTCANLALLAAATPRLEQLKILAGDVRLGDHPTLRSLELDGELLRRASLESLFAASLPALERLSLPCSDGFEATAADFAPLFDGALFPALRELRLWRYSDSLESELATAAAASPLARRVTIHIGRDDEPDEYG